MANELKDKKPDLGSDSSPVSAPKQAPVSQPKPPVKDNFNKQQNIKKQAGVTPTTLPKAKDSMKLGVPDSVRQKIMSQGFAPKTKAPDSFESKKDNFDYAKEQMSEAEQRTKASELFGTDLNKEKIYEDSHGVQWRKNPDKGDGKNYGYSRVDNPNITSNIPADTGAEPELGWNDNSMNEENQKLLNEIPNLEEQPQQPVWDVLDNPGSVVVTPKLSNYAREYLTKEGFDKTFVDTMVNDLKRNSNRADWFRQQMKNDFNKKGGK